MKRSSFEHREPMMMNQWVVNMIWVFPWLILGKFIGMKVNQWLNKSSNCFFWVFHWLISEWWWGWWSNGWNGAPYFQTRWSLKHQWMIWVDLFFVFPEMFVCQNTNGLFTCLPKLATWILMEETIIFAKKKNSIFLMDFNDKFTTPLLIKHGNGISTMYFSACHVWLPEAKFSMLLVLTTMVACRIEMVNIYIYIIHHGIHHVFFVF